MGSRPGVVSGLADFLATGSMGGSMSLGNPTPAPAETTEAAFAVPVQIIAKRSPTDVPRLLIRLGEVTLWTGSWRPQGLDPTKWVFMLEDFNGAQNWEVMHLPTDLRPAVERLASQLRIEMVEARIADATAALATLKTQGGVTGK